MEIGNLTVYTRSSRLGSSGSEKEARLFAAAAARIFAVQLARSAAAAAAGERNGQKIIFCVREQERERMYEFTKMKFK